MKKILLIAAVLLTQTVSAQALKNGNISNVTRITQDGVMYENPQWSPDGQKIAFTELGYNNLYVMNHNGSAKTQISADLGVGYMYQWSADSKEILVRDTRWIGTDGQLLRYHAAWAIDMKGKKTRLSEDAEYMQPAAWRYDALGTKSIASPDAKPIALKQQLSTLPKALAAKVTALPSSKVSFYCDSENLYLVDINGNKKLINAGASFCPALSPDGKKVAFNQMDDVCVMNIDGTGKVVIGRGFNPCWANNSQIVFERTTDDGHTYTSGELYLATIDGASLKQITSSNLIEMQPQISPDGNKIVFTSFSDGQIYVADFN